VTTTRAKRHVMLLLRDVIANLLWQKGGVRGADDGTAWQRLSDAAPQLGADLLLILRWEGQYKFVRDPQVAEGPTDHRDAAGYHNDQGTQWVGEHSPSVFVNFV
jgi:hypothetical protein